MIKWEITELKYGDVVQRITLGMQHCIEIGKAAGQAEERYKNRLKEVCANESLTLALNSLLDGMIGKGLFQRSILDHLYQETRGDRPNISALATRLLQLVSGGMVVLATYETVVRGKKGALEVTEKFHGRIADVSAKVQSVLETCVENFKDNMLNDLNAFLDTGRSHNCIVMEVSTFMRDKYDWLENFCLVFSDWQKIDQYYFSGDCVDSLHRKGKCEIVFYRTKGEPQRFSDRYEEAYKIVDEIYCGNSQEGHQNIVAKTKARGIGWMGCAVIRRSSNLRLYGTFSTKIVCIDMYNSMLYSIINRNGTAILLLK